MDNISIGGNHLQGDTSVGINTVSSSQNVKIVTVSKLEL